MPCWGWREVRVADTVSTASHTDSKARIPVRPTGEAGSGEKRGGLGIGLED